MEVRTRFAPSPTGYFHIGGARTALFTYLHAKKNKGKFILRIEDTDRNRYVEDSVKDIESSLKWLGLNWDEGPYYQSNRLNLYKKAAEKLLEEGKAYRCFCTPERLKEVKEERLKKGLKTSYDRKCRNLTQKEIDEKLKNNETYVIRLKVPLEGQTVCHDMIRGKIVFDNESLEDIILLKSDGFPTYHLAHAVDDTQMHISHVTRGEEWISSMPVHYILFNYLGYPIPEYIHLPVILSEDGGKLSKRHGATSIKEFRELGYLPEALVNFLAMLGWSYDDKKEIFSMEELLKYFDISKVSKKSAVFSYEKLKWYNGHYIRNLDLNKFYKLSLPYFIDAGYIDFKYKDKNYNKNDYMWSSSNNTLSKISIIELQENIDKISISPEDEQKIKNILPLIQERIELLQDIGPYCNFFFKTPVAYNKDDFIDKKRTLEKALNILEKILPTLEETDFNETELENSLRGFIEETGEKVRNVFMSLRVAITGRKFSPGLFETMKVIGKEETLIRIKNAINFLKTNI